MKPRLMSASMALTEHSDNQGRATDTPLAVGDREGVHSRPQLTLATAPAWRHKLILTGRLDARTVAELEDEIECLCEEGVTILTLDLRRLDAMDSVGAKAIACGGAACKRRGRAFAVVPGSPVVHRALAEVGAESWLADGRGERGAFAPAPDAVDGAPRGTSTVMVKNL